MPGGEIGVNDIKNLAEKLVANEPDLSTQEWGVLEAMLMSGADGDIKYTPGQDTDLSPSADMVKQIVTHHRSRKSEPTP